MSAQIIRDYEQKHKTKKKYNFKVGDTVNVHTKIIEGEKERIQIFSGIVIAMKGKGISQTFSIYRNAYGCSMERVFLLNSPRITKIEVEKKAKVTRSKLYHLRGFSGKKAKVKEQLFTKETPSENVLPVTETSVNKKPAVEEKKEEVKTEKKAKAKTEKTPKKPKTPKDKNKAE